MILARAKLSCGALALAALGCSRPCVPGALVLSSQAVGHPRGSTALIAGGTYEFEVGVFKGECNAPVRDPTGFREPVTDVREPVVTVISPSGARRPGKIGYGGLFQGGPVGKDPPSTFIVDVEATFDEPGHNEVELEFQGAAVRTFWTFVAQWGSQTPVQEIGGVSCYLLDWNAQGTIGCNAQQLELVPDAGTLKRRFEFGAVVRDGGVVTTFEPGSKLYTAPRFFWKTDRDGGIERYEDTGVSLERSPYGGTFIEGEPLAVTAFDDSAWVLHSDGLYLVAPSDAGDELRIVASRPMVRPASTWPYSHLLAEGPVAYVMNATAPFRTQMCGFRLSSDGSAIDEVPDSCREVGSLAAGDKESAWIGSPVLHLIKLKDGGPVLVDQLETPWSWDTGRWFLPRLPITNFSRVLIPRRIDAGIILEAYENETVAFLYVADGNNRYVWKSSSPSSVEELRTVIYDRAIP